MRYMRYEIIWISIMTIYQGYHIIAEVRRGKIGEGGEFGDLKNFRSCDLTIRGFRNGDLQWALGTDRRDEKNQKASRRAWRRPQ